jgi:hypothetical protein
MADENKNENDDTTFKPGGELPPKPAETVVVDRTMLEEILKEVQNLRGVGEEVVKLRKDNEMLLAVADKGRLQNYQAKNNPQGLVRTARAWVYEEKLVKATVTLKNQAFTDTMGRVHTDQVLNVIFEDGKEHEVTYDQFMKERTLIEGDIISRTTNDQNGQTFYTLKLKDGKEFVVNQLFTN